MEGTEEKNYFFQYKCRKFIKYMMVSLPEHSLRSVCMMNFLRESEWEREHKAKWNTSVARTPMMMYGKIDTLFGSIISLISIELTLNSRAPSRTGGRFLWAWAVSIAAACFAFLALFSGSLRLVLRSVLCAVCAVWPPTKKAAAAEERKKSKCYEY